METNKLDYNDPSKLPQRIEAIVTLMRRHEEGLCPGCGRSLCGHQVILSMVAGQSDSPRCLLCLAASESREPTDFRDGLTMFVASKPCLSQGFRLANIQEGFPAEAAPTCLQLEVQAPDAGSEAKADAGPSTDHGDVVADAVFDAGDQGCGDLVLALRIRLNKMEPGSILDLRATDPGAPTDIPAWCRLTGHSLVSDQPPHYFIRRKDNT